MAYKMLGQNLNARTAHKKALVYKPGQLYRGNLGKTFS
jgi:hypothetical protein